MLLCWSVLRLADRTAALDLADVGWVHVVFAVVWAAFMLYSEAWRGFHKQFSPRVVQRALYMPATPVLIALAPAVAMGFLHATRKRRIVAYGLVAAIVVFVLLIRLIPAPWRELVDLGVTLGLAAGTLSLVIFALRAMLGTEPGVDPEFPGST
jgi:hypothetical protein